MSKELSIIRDALNRFVTDTKNKQLDKDRGSFVDSVSAEVVKIFAPLMEEMARNSRINKDDIRAVAEEIASRINIPEINVPEIIMPSLPDVKVPEPRVTVNVPPIKVPAITMPDEMNVKGWVSLMGVDLNNPLPVQLRDASGNPVRLFENLTQIVGGGGGAFRTINIGGIQSSAWGSPLMNSDNRLRVSLETGGSGLTDTELRASSVPIAQVSGANWSVNIAQQDISQLVNQVSGANWSVSVFENKAEDAAHASGDTGFMALSVRNSTNTTFAADGDYQPVATDGIGRAITRPVQVRGLLQTAYLSLTTGTETTLLAGAASTYFDLIHVIGTNNSDAAVTVDLRSATGGGIITSIRIPANGTTGISSSVPTPQDVAADTWTADMPDITGTTVTLSALFSREV